MLFPWQRIATADSRTPRCESMNVSAALYLAGSSERRRSPTRRIMSRRDPSRWVELDVRVHHLGVLSTKPLAHPCEKPFSIAGRDIVPHRDAREYEELVGAHLYRPQIDDLVDARLGSDRGAEPVEDFLGRSLADDQPARAPGKLVRDVDQDDADDGARERVEAVIAGQHRERETDGGGEKAGQRRAVLVEHGAEGGIAELVQETPYRYALPLGGVPYLAHGDAQREGLEDRRKAEHEKADPDRAELVRMRQPLVGLVHREHAAAKEEEQGDDQRPEVALLPVPEWMARRCRPHASTDADIEKDLIHRVRDRVRRLREERPRPCHESRYRLGDRDRQVAGESRDDGARRSLGHYQPSSRSGPGSGWIVRSVRATADSPTVSAFPSQSAGVRDPPTRASSALPSVSAFWKSMRGFSPSSTTRCRIRALAGSPMRWNNVYEVAVTSFGGAACRSRAARSTGACRR